MPPKAKARSSKGKTGAPAGKTSPERERKLHYINSEPKGDSAVGTRGTALAEFGRRVQSYMADKGWNQSELGRQATLHMPGREDFGRYNVSLYIQGRQFPGPVRLRALCKALGVTPTQLVPSAATLSVDDKEKPLSFQTMEDGRVWLQVNQSTSMDAAMKIIALLGRK